MMNSRPTMSLLRSSAGALREAIVRMWLIVVSAVCGIGLLAFVGAALLPAQ
jgi:hypothetical protein